jgi:hypothetical protein
MTIIDDALAFARDRLGYDPLDTSHDAEITNALALTLSAIETYLDRKLGYEVGVRQIVRYDLLGMVRVNRYPIDVVQSVTGRTGFIQFDSDTGIVYTNGAVYGSDGKYEIVYDGGYLYGDLPPELLYVFWAVFDSVWPTFSGAGSAPSTVAAGTIESVSIPDVGTVKFATGANAAAASSGAGGFGSLIPAQYTALLDRFRNNAPIGVS